MAKCKYCKYFDGGAGCVHPELEGPCGGPDVKACSNYEQLSKDEIKKIDEDYLNK